MSHIERVPFPSPPSLATFRDAKGARRKENRVDLEQWAVVRRVGIQAALSLTFVWWAACTAAFAQEQRVTGEPQAVTECDLNGTWAIKIVTPVAWSASFVLSGGTGNITNWLNITRTQIGTNISDVTQLCGLEVPDYHSSSTFGSEFYGIRLPSTLFDAPPGSTLPTFTVRGTLSSKEIGATYTSGVVAGLFGAVMANPTTDPWPRSAHALTPVFGPDGKPGVPADVATGDGHSDIPLNPSKSVRANRVYAAFRQVLTSTGTVKSCSRAEGSGTIAVIDTKPAIDSHVFGCRHEDGSDCIAAEFALLDAAAPVYEPSANSVVTIVKIAPSSTCADIRAMNFAAP